MSLNFWGIIFKGKVNIFYHLLDCVVGFLPRFWALIINLKFKVNSKVCITYDILVLG